MKIGDFIEGYRLTSDGSSAGGGRSMWAFAERDGKAYFVKRFLSPKYPVEGSPGSEKNRELARARCRDFENQQKLIMGALDGKVKEGGSIVAPIAFVRSGPSYYKIYDRIKMEAMTASEISNLDPKDKLTILQVITHSVDILHGLGIVHGDLKPDNILIKRSSTGGITSKLIDFDDSYFSGSPPKADVIVGDPAYYSPELLEYIYTGNHPRMITLKSDMFALGLIFSQFYCGKMPGFVVEHGGNPAAIVQNLSGELAGRIRVDPLLDDLIERMLSIDPKRRPSAGEVRDLLKSFRPRIADLTVGPPEPTTSRLRSKMGGLRETSSPDGGASAITSDSSPRESRLKIKPRP